MRFRKERWNRSSCEARTASYLHSKFTPEHYLTARDALRKASYEVPNSMHRPTRSRATSTSRVSFENQLGSSPIRAGKPLIVPRAFWARVP